MEDERYVVFLCLIYQNIISSQPEDSGLTNKIAGFYLPMFALNEPSC
jgi:hypothetical protein